MSCFAEGCPSVLKLTWLQFPSPCPMFVSETHPAALPALDFRGSPLGLLVFETLLSKLTAKHRTASPVASILPRPDARIAELHAMSVVNAWKPLSAAAADAGKATVAAWSPRPVNSFQQSNRLPALPPTGQPSAAVRNDFV